MKLFINEKLIRMVSTDKFIPGAAYSLELSPEVPLMSVKPEGHVLVWNGTMAYMDALLLLMEVRKLKKLQSVTFVTDQYDEIKEFIKSQFKIVKAAGGLVLRGEKVLLMQRLGHWDLPKGKLEKGEKTLAGAIREVEEECNIRVVAEDKLTSTWHTYVQDGRKILKKTTWFLMYCLDDRFMKPQAEEGITDLRWMSRAEWEAALPGSYRSIQEVFASYMEAKVSS